MNRYGTILIGILLITAAASSAVCAEWQPHRPGGPNQGLSHEEIMRQAKRQLEINPNEAGAYESIGVVYMLQRRYDKAIPPLRKYFALRPNYSYACQRLAQCYQALKRYDEAITTYRQYLSRRPNDYLMQQEFGEFLFGLERYQEALEPFKAFLRLRPNQKIVHHNLALTNYKLKRYRWAADLFAKEVELNPDYAWAWFYYGASAYLSKQYRRCIGPFERYLKLNPDDPADVYYCMGIAHFALGKYRAAVKALTREAELNPEGAKGDPIYARDWETYLTLGDAYLELGQKQKAREAYKKLISGIDDGYFLREGVAWLVHHSEYDKARQEFRRYLTLRPDDPNGNYRLAMALWWLKRYDEAVPYMEKAVALRPDSSKYQNKLAMVYYSAKHYRDAVRQAERATEMRPRNMSFHWLLARASFRSGHYSDAIAAYERYLLLRRFKELAGERLKPPPDNVLEWLAKSYAILGDYNRAVKVLRNKSTQSPFKEWLIIYVYCAEGIQAAGRLWKREYPDTPDNFLEMGYYKAKLRNYVWGGLWDLASYAKDGQANYAALKQYGRLYLIAADLGSFNRKWSRETRKKLLTDIAGIYRKLPLKPALTRAAKKYALAAQRNIDAQQWDKAYKNLQEALNRSPWWADGHYTTALVAAARIFPSADAVRHIKQYLELEPSGKHTVQARQRLAAWKAAIRELAKHGGWVEEGVPLIYGQDRR